MNFIFDIGNVLIDFKPRIFLKKLFAEQTTSNEISEKMLEIIFSSQEWVKLDQGLITHQEATDTFCLREPAYQSEIKLVMASLEEMLTPISETIELLPKIKSSGHSLYYLSNYHKKLSEYILEENDFFKLFEGGVFSCDINVNKPDPEIYRCLLERYNLSPKDCIFFDDIEENIVAAQKEGIKGVLFTDAECVKAYV